MSVCVYIYVYIYSDTLKKKIHRNLQLGKELGFPLWRGQSIKIEISTFKNKN